MKAVAPFIEQLVRYAPFLGNPQVVAGLIAFLVVLGVALLAGIIWSLVRESLQRGELAEMLDGLTEHVRLSEALQRLHAAYPEFPLRPHDTEQAQAALIAVQHFFAEFRFWENARESALAVLERRRSIPLAQRRAWVESLRRGLVRTLEGLPREPLPEVWAFADAPAPLSRSSSEFPGYESALQHALTQLAALAALEREARRDRELLHIRHDEAEHSLRYLVGRGVEVVPQRTAADSLWQRAGQLLAEQPEHPLATQQRTQALLADYQTFLAELTTTATAAHQLEVLLEEPMQRLQAALAEAREAALPLVEDGGPQPLLAEVQRLHGWALSALRQGRAADAARHLAAVKELLRLANQLMQELQRAPQEFPESLAVAETHLRGLGEGLGRLRATADEPSLNLLLDTLQDRVAAMQAHLVAARLEGPPLGAAWLSARRRVIGVNEHGTRLVYWLDLVELRWRELSRRRGAYCENLAMARQQAQALAGAGAGPMAEVLTLWEALAEALPQAGTPESLREVSLAAADVAQNCREVLSYCVELHETEELLDHGVTQTRDFLRQLCTELFERMREREAVPEQARSAYEAATRLLADTKPGTATRPRPLAAWRWVLEGLLESAVCRALLEGRDTDAAAYLAGLAEQRRLLGQGRQPAGARPVEALRQRLEDSHAALARGERLVAYRQAVVAELEGRELLAQGRQVLLAGQEQLAGSVAEGLRFAPLPEASTLLLSEPGQPLPSWSGFREIAARHQPEL